MSKLKLIFIVLFLMLFFIIKAQCNCYTELCQKRYDQIAFLTTHNAFNSQQDNFAFPNQSYGITRQLVDGVRALMIDVYDKDGVPTVYHSFPILGSRPLSQNLNEIYDFMVNNPKEVITIIFECYVTANAIETALNSSGLLPMAYAKTAGNQWPTLHELIDSGKRLVVFSDKNDASSKQKWYHYLWKYAVETSFSVEDANDFSCTYNRGNASNDLYILNHFIVSKSVGAAVKSKAEIVNSNPFLSARIKKCAAETTKFPNFITVDFYNVGDCMAVVNELNVVLDTILPIIDTFQKPTVWPNPMLNTATVKMPSSSNPPYKYQINNLAGQKISTVFVQWGNTFLIERNNLPKGVYLVSISDVRLKKYVIKLVVN